MIDDDATIKRLSLRSDLPRLNKEGFFLFAELEGDEQKLDELEKTKLLARAFAGLVAREEARSDRPLPPLVPRAWRSESRGADWLDIDLACELESPFERRTRDGRVLGIARFLHGRLRLYLGAFAYFAMDDLRPIDELDTTGYQTLA